MYIYAKHHNTCDNNPYNSRICKPIHGIYPIRLPISLCQFRVLSNPLEAVW
jgi:hypothetical protein